MIVTPEFRFPMAGTDALPLEHIMRGGDGDRC